MHRCSKCSTIVEPNNWYRLTSGYILCASCWFESETKELYREHDRNIKTSTRCMWRGSWTSTRYVYIWCILRHYGSICIQVYEVVD